MKTTGLWRRHSSGLFWIVVVTLASLFCTWELVYGRPSGWQPDEGAHVMSAYWLSKGLQLYSQIAVLLWPLFLEFLGLVFRLSEPSLNLARSLVVFTGALYLIGTGIAGRRLFGSVGGIVSVLMLLLDNRLFEVSGLVLSEVPALAVVCTAVILALVYLSSGRRACLVGAGLACGLSLLVKPLVPGLPAWLGAVVLAHHWIRSEGEGGLKSADPVTDVGLAFVSFIAPLGLCLVFYDPSRFAYATLFSVIDVRGVDRQPLAHNWAIIANYISSYRGPALLAAAGLFLIDVKDRTAWINKALVGLLLVLSLAFLSWHSPLFSRHALALSLPIALFAGASVDSLACKSVLRQHRARWMAAALIAAFAVCLIVVDMPGVLGRTGYQMGREELVAQAAGTELLGRITSPGEIVASDDLSLAFAFQKYAPPQLSDISEVRIDAGNLTDAEVTSAVRDFDVQTVCLWTRRFRRLAVFTQWAEAHFVSSSSFGHGRAILHGRRYDHAADIPSLQPTPGVVFGDRIELIGYRLYPKALRPGDSPQIILYWRCRSPVERNYSVLVRLVDSGGVSIAQSDTPPVNGLYPTSSWRRGEILADVRPFSLAGSVSTGDYDLLIRLYDPASSGGESLNAVTPNGVKADVLLTTVHIDGRNRSPQDPG
jgi:hypothetical protein